MRQRVKLAATLLKKPLLLLLDEPSTNLDNEGVSRMWEALQNRPLTLILATNKASEAERAGTHLRVGPQDERGSLD
jgi:heme exporter protein A